MTLRFATRFATMLLISSIGAGCALQTRKPGDSLPRSQVVETVETDADRLLNYYAYITELQGETLLQEYRRVQETYGTGPNDFNRMQLIMLLSSPSASFRDTGLAHTLLKDWLNEQYNAYSKLHPLALLYDNYLAELQRRDEVIERTTDQLRQANDRVERQNERISKQKAELATEKERLGQLQEKLDALLEMEKNLIERGQTPQPDIP
jgi:predicted ribosome quality control (RQC) complex YloA/Tae2 family protein